MMEVARESEHPRAYEVLSGMIKNVADVNDKLMDLNKKNKDINKSDVPALDNATTNNNVFIGSTTDLQRMLQDVKTEQPEAKVNNVIDITPRIKDE
jgi:alpha-L-fucosidase